MTKWQISSSFSSFSSSSTVNYFSHELWSKTNTLKWKLPMCLNNTDSPIRRDWWETNWGHPSLNYLSITYSAFAVSACVDLPRFFATFQHPFLSLQEFFGNNYIYICNKKNSSFTTTNFFHNFLFANIILRWQKI